jgi:hypothetical protein
VGRKYSPNNRPGQKEERIDETVSSLRSTTTRRYMEAYSYCWALAFMNPLILMYALADSKSNE